MWAISFSVLVGVVVAVCVAAHYSLKNDNTTIKNAWEKVDVELRKKFDLIPNFIERTKEVIKPEEDILVKLSLARGIYTKAVEENDIKGMAAADARLNSALQILESKYDLNQDNVLQESLKPIKETGSKVDYAKEFYNDVAAKYNKRYGSFPNKLIAKFHKMGPVDLFTFEGINK